MEPLMRRFLVGFQTVFASLKKGFGMNGEVFASQRMCPFCGLITSRRKTYCLECGKQLNPA
jgi:hypothetical protein